MKIAAGFKAHSGWAALVVIGKSDDGLQLVDRRRIELVDPNDASWAKQPYHAADDLPADEARTLVTRGIESAHRVAVREMRAFVERSQIAGHEIAGCAVLVGTPMPEWTTEQILAVHFRMHKAEGVLFPAALVSAATGCGLDVVEVPEKELRASADAARQIGQLGKSAGPPWGKDQKTAALAAVIALKAD
jgi:hypothetical protein